MHIEQGGNFLHRFALLYQGLRVFNVLLPTVWFKDAADGLIGIAPGYPRDTLPQSLAGPAKRGCGSRMGLLQASPLQGRSAPPPGPASWQDQRQFLPTNPALPEPPEGVPSCSQGKIPTTYRGTVETLRTLSPRRVPARDRGFGGILRRVNQSTPSIAIAQTLQRTGQETTNRTVYLMYPSERVPP